MKEKLELDAEEWLCDWEAKDLAPELLKLQEMFKGACMAP